MTDDGAVQFGIVRVGDTLIGIPVARLSEVFHAHKYEELPQTSELLRGGISLRGQLVPVADLQRLGRIAKATAKPQFGVIIAHEDRLLAIFVDEIVGIATKAGDDIHAIAQVNQVDNPLFCELFAHEDRFVSLLDVPRLFSLPGMCAVQRQQAHENKARQAFEPMLTFAAGSVLYTVPAVEVHAAIHKQVIEKTAITMGPCLGEITYHRRRIPVLCPVRILGLGIPQATQMTEVVALRFPGNLIVGFAVDAIHEIGVFAAAKETTVPIWQADRSFIQSIIMREDGAQIYKIDLFAMHQAEDLQEIATLSQPDETPPEIDEQLTKQTQNVTTVKERYLVVDATEKLAIPLSEVNCIVEQPETITPTHIATPGFRGYFSCFGESIALFDLGECLGRAPAADPDAKILLTGQAGHQVGYKVNHVLGIEMSEWCEKPPSDRASDNKALVQLGTGSAAQVLPTCSLIGTLERTMTRTA